MCNTCYTNFSNRNFCSCLWLLNNLFDNGCGCNNCNGCNGTWGNQRVCRDCCGNLRIMNGCLRNTTFGNGCGCGGYNRTTNTRNGNGCGCGCANTTSATSTTTNGETYYNRQYCLNGACNFCNCCAYNND